MIKQLNGALFVSDADRSPVGAGMVYKKTDGGTWGSGAAYGEIKDALKPRGRFTFELHGPDGAPLPAALGPPRQKAWLDLASGATDPNPVADVLHALSGEPHWFDLWKAEEIMHGQQDVFPTTWPKHEIEWFRATATLYRHSPSVCHVLKARKWFKANGNPPNMELVQARRLIATVAAPWLDWKVSRHR